MVSGSAPSAFGDGRTHSLRWIQPSNAAEAAVSAWRYVMHHTAAGPCFALTEAPLTQRCSFFFFFFFSPYFKGVQYRGCNIFWPCCNCRFHTSSCPHDDGTLQ